LSFLVCFAAVAVFVEVVVVEVGVVALADLSAAFTVVSASSLAWRCAMVSLPSGMLARSSADVRVPSVEFTTAVPALVDAVEEVSDVCLPLVVAVEAEEADARPARPRALSGLVRMVLGSEEVEVEVEAEAALLDDFVSLLMAAIDGVEDGMSPLGVELPERASTATFSSSFSLPFSLSLLLKGSESEPSVLRPRRASLSGSSSFPLRSPD
jgi:hypothetical protein